MKLIRYCKIIELEVCHRINIDQDGAMITFFLVGFNGRFYYRNEGKPIEFIDEIIKGTYRSGLSVSESNPEEMPDDTFRDEDEENQEP